MTGIDHRSKRPSPAGAKTPASKLHGKDLKVKKLPKFSVPAGPLPCPPGCALVPADLLHQLQSEVSKTALPVLRQEAPEVQHAPRRKEPEVHAQREDSLPNLTHPHATPAVAAKAPKPRLKDGGARPIVIVKHAGVSTEDTADGLGPPGARHANVGRVDAVEEGTQTSPQESVQPAAPTAPQTVSPTAHGPHSGVQGNAGDENKAVPWQPPQPVVTPVGMAVFSAGPALPGSPDKMNSTDHGRFDLFGMDKFTAEKDRDRKRLQAQMLAEQIQESAKTGMSGAALGSARGASQASRASKNPTSTEWRTSQPHATPDAGGAPATGGASDMHTFGEAAAPVQPNASGSSNTRPAPADSLSELLQGQSRMIAASEIPEAYIVPYNAAYSAAPAAVAPVGHPDYSRPRPPGVLVEESPFASPARGIAVRRSSRSYRRDSYGGWGGRMLASPPLISRGGLNVQANWEPLGVEGGGHPFPFHKGSRRSRGPGQVPIGINPSIQAQSAMLREMYPNVAMGGGGAGPFSRA